MLVLSRKKRESLLIGDNVRITVNKIEGNRVTLGIEAPDHVRILRSELKAATVTLEPVLQQTPALSGSVK